MVYTWKEASCIKADANIAGQQFEKLEAKGLLTAKGVLDANRAEDAPLHSEFEWRDGVAAEKYRESQAAKMIQAICVVSEKREPVRAYYVLQPKASYESVQSIMSVETKKLALLDIALAELKAFRRKYAGLEELADVFGEVDKL